MKKFLLISTAILLTALVFYSCKKDATHINTEEQAVQQLVQSADFMDFTKDFIPDLTRLMTYHRPVSIQQRSADFLQQVNLADDDETKLVSTYQAFALNFETAVLLKNKIDNDLLRLLNQHRFLLDFTDAQTQNILLTALDLVRTSPDPKWQQVKEAINSRMKGNGNRIAIQSVRLDLVDTGTAQPGVTWDEIWDCVKRALGVGTAGVLSVAGMKKLAKEGIQEIVITATKFLAKHAGWFGLAITLIDFGSCVYHESRD